MDDVGMSAMVVCPYCDGSGITINEDGAEVYCPHCFGAGEIERGSFEHREWCEQNAGGYGPDD